MIKFNKQFMDYELGKDKEWVLANGLGGYASSTIIGANTRKYHGLLIASLNPPVDRWLLLSKLEEEVVLGGESYELSTNKYPGVIHPQGFGFQKEFIWDILPSFVYRVGDVIVHKTVCMVHDFNATIVSYRIVNDGVPFKFKVKPLVNCRGLHANMHKKDVAWGFTEKKEDKITEITPSIQNTPQIILSSDVAWYSSNGMWYYNMAYDVESFRGTDDVEDHWCPGEFVLGVGGGVTECNILAVGGLGGSWEVFDRLYSENPEDFRELMKKEKDRLKQITKNFYSRYNMKEKTDVNLLIQAADSFIVRREDMKSIIAGYHWFADWGRDTMISIPGLTLVTGRFEDTKQILKLYVKYCDQGIKPTFFHEKLGVAGYNNVDASLWFINTAKKLLDYTQDFDFIKQELWGTMKEVIEYYVGGTLYDIRMDDDCLISAGSPDDQLTWMDARIGDWVVTPRHGKAVEVNALWYNALRIMKELANEFGEDSLTYRKLSASAKKSFNHMFWNQEKECLYDVVSGDLRDDSIRPNQIFAVSLPHGMLDNGRDRNVVERVREHLLTPYGLRSLSPEDVKYAGFYGGPQSERDRAYHQGTVWMWLLGSFVTAYVKVNGGSSESREYALKNFVKPALTQLGEVGVGTLSEIFDGDPPHKPRGCVSQAWSVAELLRCYVEDILDGGK